MFELIFAIAIFAIPMLLFGVVIGRSVEKNHFRRLSEFETSHRDFLITQVKTFPSAVRNQLPPTLVCSEVVIASDYLKNFLSSWRGVFGGEMKAYTRICDRAKREAVVRLVQQAESLGYNAICNVRIETVEIGSRKKKGQNAMASCLASATAYTAERT